MEKAAHGLGFGVRLLDRRPGHGECEFLAADPCRDPARLGQDSGKGHDDPVADPVAVAVVDRLEMVDVGEDQHAGLRAGSGEAAFQRLTMGQAGQAVAFRPVAIVTDQPADLPPDDPKHDQGHEDGRTEQHDQVQPVGRGAGVGATGIHQAWPKR